MGSVGRVVIGERGPGPLSSSIAEMVVKMHAETGVRPDLVVMRERDREELLAECGIRGAVVTRVEVHGCEVEVDERVGGPVVMYREDWERAKGR